MNTWRLICVLLLLMVPTAHFAQSKTDPALDKIRTAYLAAWAVKDAARVASLYAVDGSMFLPDGPILKGRAAIQAHYTAVFNAETWDLTLTPIESSTSGTGGFEAGTFGTQARGSKQHVKGKYVFVFRRAGNAWQIAYDVSNVDAAPAPPVKK